MLLAMRVDNKETATNEQPKAHDIQWRLLPKMETAVDDKDSRHKTATTNNKDPKEAVKEDSMAPYVTADEIRTVTKCQRCFQHSNDG